METENGTLASIPIGEFLTTDEPVWVWDASARRILWANQAGRDFWGAKSLDALRARRFSARNKSVERLTKLAAEPGGAKEWVETLTFDAAFGRKVVKCYLQGLHVAGGKPGLIVKALGTVNGRAHQPDKETSKTSEAAPAGNGGSRTSRSDQAALNAIADRMKKAAKSSPRSSRPAAPTAKPPADTPHSAHAADMDHIERGVREFCHEMRNPLSVISGFAERIKDIAPPGRKRDQLIAYADDIMESASLAMAILSDFSSRTLHPDLQPPEPEPIDLRSTVESCLRLIAPLARTSNIKVYRRTESHLPRLLAAERVLKQILLNLLMNAVRHHKTGGQIKVSARARKDGTVRIAVADDGKGMTKKEIRAALGNSRQPLPPQPGRSGLGLPLVKRLVEGAGGRLSIESARGKGTTVEMLFPSTA